MYFRPMPVLTIVTAICIAILLWLGTWQYNRLQWKTDLIAEVDAASQAAPFTSLAQIERAAANAEPLEFRRVRLSVDVAENDQPFMIYRAADRQIKWRPFSLISDKSGAAPVYFTGQLVSDGEKADYNQPRVEDTEIAGYVRRPAKLTRLARRSNVIDNRYFGFNPVPEKRDWAEEAISGKANVAYFIEIDHALGDAPAELPEKTPELRNNHFDYMMTWYSFALILLVIYIIMHRRAGRLKIGKGA